VGNLSQAAGDIIPLHIFFSFLHERTDVPRDEKVFIAGKSMIQKSCSQLCGRRIYDAQLGKTAISQNTQEQRA